MLLIHASLKVSGPEGYLAPSMLPSAASHAMSAARSCWVAWPSTRTPTPPTPRHRSALLCSDCQHSHMLCSLLCSDCRRSRMLRSCCQSSGWLLDYRLKGAKGC